MKLKVLLPIIFILFTITGAGFAHAEIYKWKDDKGNSLYSDVPPPSNVQTSVLGAKKTVPAQQVAPKASTNITKLPVSQEEAAAKRQKNAEDAKKKDQVQEAELKQKQENCTKAKADYQLHKQGGRIYKMNEKGEREYLDDASLAKGLEQAQSDMDKYCSE
ncbi:MAG: DUF4124 domain-containing protein [Methylophilaceae bacterium]|nr:DUF4124 domain-containing protein [Methylophilaceae bacterium]